MTGENTRSLAERLRPKELSEVVGQKHLLSENALFRHVIESGRIPNMIFYGPSGTGKTTVADIIAAKSGMTLRRLNATTCSLSDVKAVCAETGSLFGSGGILLYLDEIQYFNKKQQQSLLENMEDGRVTLICSTTENPYFAIYPAVLSRSSVFEFRPVEPEEIEKALFRAYGVMCEEYKFTPSEGEKSDAEKAIRSISSMVSGDVRRAMGALEVCFLGTGGRINESTVSESLSEFAMKLDRDGNEHYDLLSALQKSVRGSDPDAAVFYLARLLEGGDLISPCRRLLVMAAEDIGLAHPAAISVVKACVDTAERLGLPEARLPLAEAAIYLATLPKSNSAYTAYGEAAEDVKNGRGVRVPDYLRDSMQPSAEHNKDYVYPHDYPSHYYPQRYLPEDVAHKHYYEYGDNKTETAAKQYWDNIKKQK